MEKGEESSNKMRVESESPMDMDQVKQEVLDGDKATEAGSRFPVEVSTTRVEVTVKIDMAKLHCPICILPLKPPIFQCAVGHLACGACRDQLTNSDRCFECGHAGGYGRNTPLEDVLRSIMIQCPYDAYGCRSYVVYYDADEHQRACPHAPCRCSEPGCSFVGSPPMLCVHLRDTHCCPLDKIRYGRPCQLWVSESHPRRLLVAEEDERVFLLSVSVAPLRGVSLESVTAAAGPPHCTCKMCATGNAAAATGKVPTVFVEMEVPNSAAPGEAAAAEDEVPQLVVQRKTMLHGPSKALHLRVRIGKVET